MLRLGVVGGCGGCQHPPPHPRGSTNQASKQASKDRPTSPSHRTVPEALVEEEGGDLLEDVVGVVLDGLGVGGQHGEADLVGWVDGGMGGWMNAPAGFLNVGV